MIRFAILNESTRVTDAEAAKMTAAVAIQMTTQVSLVWDRYPPEVEFYHDVAFVPSGACIIRLKDSIAESGALGFHTEGQDGSYWGDIAVSPVLDNGGGVLEGGAAGYSVASVLSHEVIELFVDPSVNSWSEGPALSAGSSYALEACDPVEGSLYPVGLPDGTRVLVSDWVTPLWFDAMAPQGSMFDWMGVVRRPFTMAPGGYMVVSRGPGTEQNVFGMQRPPAWRLAMKTYSQSRTSRRRRPAPAASVAQLDKGEL